ncbi:MAG: hypothetical protein LBP53_06030 [Candidatus Peribacteria bacterium]|nr:hypothetical protein [Candidatus Peribacteria bacterium]
MLVKHALFLADELKAKCVIVFTHTGSLAKMVAGFKPNQNVFAFTPYPEIINLMRILFGIQGMKMKQRADHTTENQEIALQMLLEQGLVSSGDKIVIIADKKRGEKTDPLIRVTIVE